MLKIRQWIRAKLGAGVRRIDGVVNVTNFEINVKEVSMYELKVVVDKWWSYIKPMR